MFDQTEKQNKTKYWIKSACHVSVPTTDKLREEQMSSLYLKKERKRKTISVVLDKIMLLDSEKEEENCFCFSFKM